MTDAKILIWLFIVIYSNDGLITRDEECFKNVIHNSMEQTDESQKFKTIL